MIWVMSAILIVNIALCVCNFVVIAKITKFAAEKPMDLSGGTRKHDVTEGFEDKAQKVWKTKYEKRRISKRSEAWLTQREGVNRE